MGQKLAQNFKDKIGSSAMQQYGAGKSSASLSDIWKTPAEGVSGGTDGTPKTDMFNGDYNISLKKAGGSQLASAAGGETIATFYAALSYLSKDKQGDKLITGLMSAIEKNFEKLFLEDQLGAYEGIPQSTGNYAYAYCVGQGVEANLEECLFWNKVAVYLGDVLSMEALAWIYKNNKIFKKF